MSTQDAEDMQTAADGRTVLMSVIRESDEWYDECYPKPRALLEGTRDLALPARDRDGFTAEMYAVRHPRTLRMLRKYQNRTKDREP